MAMNIFINPLNPCMLSLTLLPSCGATELSSQSECTYTRERRGAGKGGTGDRGLNQKSLEFCKYFFSIFYENI